MHFNALLHADVSVLFVKHVELVSRLGVCTQVSIRPPNPVAEWTGAVRETGFDAVKSSESPSCFFCPSHTNAH